VPDWRFYSSSSLKVCLAKLEESIKIPKKAL